MDTSHLFLRDRELTAHANIYNIYHLYLIFVLLFVSENSSLKKGGLKVYDKHLQRYSATFSPNAFISIPYPTRNSHVYFSTMR